MPSCELANKHAVVSDCQRQMRSNGHSSFSARFERDHVLTCDSRLPTSADSGARQNSCTCEPVAILTSTFRCSRQQSGYGLHDLQLFRLAKLASLAEYTPVDRRESVKLPIMVATAASTTCHQETSLSL